MTKPSLDRLLRPRAAVPVSARDRSLLFGVVSVLLSVPDAEVLQSLPDLTAQVDRIEQRSARRPLGEFLGWLARNEGEGAVEHHAHVFDPPHCSTLSMTSYLRAHADRRDGALGALDRLYRAHGLHLAEGEDADQLRVVLEFASVVGPGAGEAPLHRHRAGLDLLHAYLADLRSPYGLLIDAVALALPARALATPCGTWPPYDTPVVRP